ncbi:hypothetical protein C7S16_0794 [Burkholderia thailandensis]|uniref:Uncharacterized protein n=1 Tax=Burkholderia thailandensis TaxID=57975 RepID=A0AAW9CYS3_BURTH|nr:hypothetical protein [Burkholderia thailandensis]MDW9256060.1 hypothetical protein [Burkholderia thailandensis]
MRASTSGAPNRRSRSIRRSRCSLMHELRQIIKLKQSIIIVLR